MNKEDTTSTPIGISEDIVDVVEDDDVDAPMIVDEEEAAETEQIKAELVEKEARDRER